MLSQHMSLLVYKVSAFILFPCASFNKISVIPIWHKADILAVMLSGIYKMIFFCQFPDLLFVCIFSQREPGMGQLTLVIK